MSTIGMVLTVILMILAVILAAIILMQSKRSAGLGAVSGNSSDTYWSKNKGNSVEGALERYTKIGGALFMVLALFISCGTNAEEDAFSGASFFIGLWD